MVHLGWIRLLQLGLFLLHLRWLLHLGWLLHLAVIQFLLTGPSLPAVRVKKVKVHTLAQLFQMYHFYLFIYSFNFSDMYNNKAKNHRHTQMTEKNHHRKLVSWYLGKHYYNTSSQLFKSGCIWSVIVPSKEYLQFLHLLHFWISLIVYTKQMERSLMETGGDSNIKCTSLITSRISINQHVLQMHLSFFFDRFRKWKNSETFPCDSKPWFVIKFVIQCELPETTTSFTNCV